jgi:hypothetical protein
MRETRVSNKMIMRDLIERLKNQLLDELDYSTALQCQLVDNSVMPIQRGEEYRYVVKKEELSDEG